MPRLEIRKPTGLRITKAEREGLQRALSSPSGFAGSRHNTVEKILVRLFTTYSPPEGSKLDPESGEFYLTKGATL